MVLIMENILHITCKYLFCRAILSVGRLHLPQKLHLNRLPKDSSAKQKDFSVQLKNYLAQLKDFLERLKNYLERLEDFLILLNIS